MALHIVHIDSAEQKENHQATILPPSNCKIVDEDRSNCYVEVSWHIAIEYFEAMLATIPEEKDIPKHSEDHNHNRDNLVKNRDDLVKIWFTKCIFKPYTKLYVLSEIANRYLQCRGPLNYPQGCRWISVEGYLKEVKDKCSCCTKNRGPCKN